MMRLNCVQRYNFFRIYAKKSASFIKNLHFFRRKAKGYGRKQREPQMCDSLIQGTILDSFPTRGAKRSYATSCTYSALGTRSWPC